jgi:hypothetical protein
MKNRIPLYCTMSILLACTACKTHVPMVQHESASYQKKAEAVEHWNRLGGEVCHWLAHNTALSGKPIYLQPPQAPATQFDVAYAKLLKVQLVNQSLNVVEDPRAAAFILSFESQLVSHGDRDFYCCNPTSVWSLFGYELVHFFTGDATGSDYSTQQDLLVTTFVRSPADGKPVTALNQIVYVPPGDVGLYFAPKPPEPFPGWASR